RAGARRRRPLRPGRIGQLHRRPRAVRAGRASRARARPRRRLRRAVLPAIPNGRVLVQQALLSWSARTRRDLPWRHTRDPWAILVSELMLQQTQVPRVVPKYHAFMARFPTAAACASSSVADVVRAWAGLGYNRRAVSLHRAAVAVVERHGGVLPEDLEALLALPGIGPYTARAVLTFAF